MQYVIAEYNLIKILFTEVVKNVNFLIEMQFHRL